MYYDDKTSILQDLFGTTEVTVTPDGITVDGLAYPIIDDVIVLLDPSRWPASLVARGINSDRNESRPFAEDIQFSFGEEWKTFPDILPEHEVEFLQYFDVIDLESLRESRVVDFGCGVGRWSSFLARRCREIVLVDFSDAVFVARQNLRGMPNALFFLGDITALPFEAGAADFGVCLGVLHHLPMPALEQVRALARVTPRLLVYLYYALDNRPPHFRLLLRLVTACRTHMARIRQPGLRSVLTWALTLGLYVPCVAAGHVAQSLGLARHVPLFEWYAGKSLRRIRQDVYDRFFTRIEQRFSRTEIGTLRDDFSKIVISDGPPYWHFLCEPWDAG